MNYTLISSFHCSWNASKAAFHKIWFDNIKRHCEPWPKKIVVIVSDHSPCVCFDGIDYIHLTGNLGHWTDLMENRKPHRLSGWMGEMLAGAALAYCNETDFIYLEEDALAFGNWVERMYADMGDGDMVFGGKHTSEPWQPCSQSLFLVRHSFIPDFVAFCCSHAPQRDKDNLGEHVFVHLKEKYGDKIKELSFGVDRQRPIPYDEPVFYCQQVKPDELEELRKRKLL